MNKKVFSFLVVSIIEFLVLTLIVIIGFFIQKNNYYDVVFNDNGVVVKKIRVKKNSTISMPDNIKKDGYVIDKWMIGQEEYNFDDKVTNNIVIDIIWKIEEEEEIVIPKPEKEPIQDPEPQPEQQPETEPQPEQTPVQEPQPAPQPQPTPTPEPEPQPVVKNYTIGVSQVDAYSPDCYLTVYENGNAISVNSIAYSDGMVISAAINGSLITVAKSEIEGESSLLVTLNDNSIVLANIY